MLTERQMLAKILRMQHVHSQLLLLVLKGERNIELSQEDINQAVAALGLVTSDLVEMAGVTDQRVKDVDNEVQALKAQLAEAGTPVDTTALDNAVTALTSAHVKLKTSIQNLHDDANVPQAGSESTSSGGATPVGNAGEPVPVDTGAPDGATTGDTTVEVPASGQGDVSVTDES